MYLNYFSSQTESSRMPLVRDRKIFSRRTNIDILRSIKTKRNVNMNKTHLNIDQSKEMEKTDDLSSTKQYLISNGYT